MILFSIQIIFTIICFLGLYEIAIMWWRMRNFFKKIIIYQDFLNHIESIYKLVKRLNGNEKDPELSTDLKLWSDSLMHVLENFIQLEDKKSETKSKEDFDELKQKLNIDSPNPKSNYTTEHTTDHFKRESNNIEYHSKFNLDDFSYSKSKSSQSKKQFNDYKFIHPSIQKQSSNNSMNNGSFHQMTSENIFKIKKDSPLKKNK